MSRSETAYWALAGLSAAYLFFTVVLPTVNAPVSPANAAININFDGGLPPVHAGCGMGAGCGCGH